MGGRDQLRVFPPLPISLVLDGSPYRPGFARAKPSISWTMLPNVSGSELAIALYGYQMDQIRIFRSTHSWKGAHPMFSRVVWVDVHHGLG